MALESAETFGDELAVIDGATRLSFREVAEQMVAVARSLIALGVEPGDRVALWAPNSAPWMCAALGVMATGAWLVPLNTRFKGPEAAYILAKTQARTLICVNGFLGVDHAAMVREADPTLPALDQVVVLQGPPTDGATTFADFLELGRSVDESIVLDRIDAIGPDDVSDIIFTSGTTGHPKGVMLRHGASLHAFCDLYNEGYQLGRGDRLLVVAPFFHCFGYKAGWMLALAVGATSVLVTVFDPADALKTIEEQRITHLAGAPTMFAALLDHPTRAQRDFSSVRVAIASAAYVPVELVERMCADFGLDWALSGYGLTEAHALVSRGRADDPAEIVANWSGEVIRGCEVRIVDDDGNDVALGERGELLVRGFQVMHGYYDDPEATAVVIDADGWLHTGDIAFANAENYIKVCDRKKDMFIVNGFNVAPAEVEAVLAEWDAVAMAAVIGIPDATHGDVGVAFIVPAPGAHPTADDVIAHARERLATYKVPRHVIFVDELPMNATGKVLKAQLQERLTGDTGR